MPASPNCFGSQQLTGASQAVVADRIVLDVGNALVCRARQIDVTVRRAVGHEHDVGLLPVQAEDTVGSRSLSVAAVGVPPDGAVAPSRSNRVCNTGPFCPATA